MAIATMKVLGQEGEHVLRGSRGSSSPYRIRNRTGCPIYVWSDLDGHAINKDIPPVQIAHDSSVDWRFDDWKVMREVNLIVMLVTVFSKSPVSTSLQRATTALDYNS